MGLALLNSLVEESSLDTVCEYMGHIQSNAEATVRAMLRAFSASRNLGERGTVRASDRLDEGAEITLEVTIDATDGSAIFDFRGTAPQLHSNLNAPKAVTYSAVIYSLRCLCDSEMPLNQARARGGSAAPSRDPRSRRPSKDSHPPQLRRAASLPSRSASPKAACSTPRQPPPWSAAMSSPRSGWLMSYSRHLERAPPPRVA